MTFQGHIENGKVVFDDPLTLPNGTVVTVVVNETKRGDQKAQTLYESMKPIIGIAKHLPPDASSKIDEVLYGRSDT